MVIILLVTFAFLFSFSTFISQGFSQISEDSITIYSDFEMIEFGETQGELINMSSIEYTFPLDSGEIGEMELNFTDIQYNREVFPVEDTVTISSKQLQKNVAKGYAVQINITEPTEIYGANIYGVEINPATTTTIMVQILGYDNISDQPNATIFASTSVNMTNQTGWHIHQFSAPVLLQQGYYYLVLNGTEMGPPEQANYWWGLNNLNPNNPNLITWVHFGGIWINNATGEPFLYKLDQKILAEFYPSDINLTAEINDINFPISNGIDPGTGRLSINSTVSIPDSTISISIDSNTSYGLIFNVSFHFCMHNHLTTQGSALISASLENQWTIMPIFQRKFNNYSVEFNYPDSWQNISVFRRIGLPWIKINSEIVLFEINKTIYIPNSTLQDGAEWMITATSPNIDYSLNFPITNWNPGQELQFSVESPISSGNQTFVLINPLGFVDYWEVMEISTEETMFSYVLPSNSVEGTYIAKLYWNNGSDAGFQSQEIQVEIPPVPFTINPLTVALIVLLVVGISASGVVLFVVGRNYRRKIIERQEKIYTNCIDIMNLDYLMVTDKNSGLNVYTQNFSGKEIDAALISGFLQAIHSFGIEMMKVEDRSQTIKLEYKDSIVLMSEFVNLRLILLMKESPSRNFLFSLEDLAYDIYKDYGGSIDSFNGDVNPFRGIENLLKKHLNITFISPLKIAKIEKLEKVRIGQSDRELINQVVKLMKTENQDHFFIRDLLPTKECSPKDIEAVLKLFDKNVFQVIEKK
jgi:hypothetical protein